MIYRILLFIHVGSAAVSIGPFTALFPLLRRLRLTASEVESGDRGAYAQLDRDARLFKACIRIAKHSGHVLIGSGVLLALLGHWSYRTSWIDMTVLVLVLSLVFLARAFSPHLKKMLQPGANRPLLMRKLTVNLWLYLFVMFVMLAFMVIKPKLW